MLALDKLPADASLTVLLGTLLHDVGKPGTFDDTTDRIRFNGNDKLGAEMARKILRRLKYSTEIVERVVSLVEDHLRFINVPNMKTSTLKRFFRKPYFEEDLALHRADCLAGSGKLDTYEFSLQKLREFEAEPEMLRPKLPIDGRDLIEMGLTPGPNFKAILAQVEDEVLEGRISTREEALEFINRVR